MRYRAKASAGQALCPAAGFEAVKDGKGNAQTAVTEAESEAGLVGSVVVAAAADPEVEAAGEVNAGTGIGVAMFAVVGFDG